MCTCTRIAAYIQFALLPIISGEDIYTGGSRVAIMLDTGTIQHTIKRTSWTSNDVPPLG